MRNPITQKVNILFNTAKELAAEVAILKHCNNGLRNAIVLQKKKGKKGKRLNLYREETTGVECYSPT